MQIMLDNRHLYRCLGSSAVKDHLVIFVYLVAIVLSSGDILDLVNEYAESLAVFTELKQKKLI